MNTVQSVTFLALLDYISRAHEIEICPSSVRVAIISEPNAQISFKFWFLLPRFLFPSTWNPVQVIISNATHPTNSSQNSSQTCPEFSSQLSSQYYVGDFRSFEFPMFRIWVDSLTRMTRSYLWPYDSLTHSQGKI